MFWGSADTKSTSGLTESNSRGGVTTEGNIHLKMRKWNYLSRKQKRKHRHSGGGGLGQFIPQAQPVRKLKAATKVGS